MFCYVLEVGSIYSQSFCDADFWNMVSMRPFVVVLIVCSSVVLFDVAAAHLVPTIAESNDDVQTFDESSRSETDASLILPHRRHKRGVIATICAVVSVIAGVVGTSFAIATVVESKKTPAIDICTCTNRNNCNCN